MQGLIVASLRDYFDTRNAHATPAKSSIKVNIAAHETIPAIFIHKGIGSGISDP
jgi:hypothetical protein